MKTIKYLIVIVGVCLAGGAGLIYSGLYNIGADQPHWALTAYLVDILREQSIDAHIKEISVPALDDQKLVAEGAEHYAPMCSSCHLAPGLGDTEIRKGLYPQPPNLSLIEADDDRDDDTDLDDARQFWIIKHGIKLTGMPAWGTTHDDRSIWALVAFVRALPDLSPAQYQNLTTPAGEHSHSQSGHDHSVHEADLERPPSEEIDHEHSHNEVVPAHAMEADGHHNHGSANEHSQGGERTERSHTH